MAQRESAVTAAHGWKGKKDWHCCEGSLGAPGSRDKDPSTEVVVPSVGFQRVPFVSRLAANRCL